MASITLVAAADEDGVDAILGLLSVIRFERLKENPRLEGGAAIITSELTRSVCHSAPLCGLVSSFSSSQSKLENLMTKFPPCWQLYIFDVFYVIIISLLAIIYFTRLFFLSFLSKMPFIYI